MESSSSYDSHVSKVCVELCADVADILVDIYFQTSIDDTATNTNRLQLRDGPLRKLLMWVSDKQQGICYLRISGGAQIFGHFCRHFWQMKFFSFLFFSVKLTSVE